MRLVVLDAHRQSRERIKALFGRTREFEILAFCPDARSAFVMADTVDPDVFLVDPVLLEADGYAVIRSLRICVPECAIVAFTNPASTQAVLKAFRAGAHAFVLKTDPAESIFEALRAVVRGECHVSQASLEELRRELDPDGEEESRVATPAPDDPPLH
jgi:DNA-binding NarL/FixJ family response regulator